MAQKKFLLTENDMPDKWYNIQADMPNPLKPALHPGTKQPAGPQDFAPLFPMELIKQEVSKERWIQIPDPVRDAYLLWRPTPMIRATALEKALGTPAKIYFKYEGTSPTGSHKPNTAIPQAYYNKMEGVKRIATETGAGQWGSSLAFACQHFGLECKVFMVRISFEQKPYRKHLMEIFKATVVASPSNETDAGRKILSQFPDTPGSLGIAISEAVEVAAKDPDTKYSLGSVLNHVLTHQTIIGLEAQKQFAMADDYPDIVIGCFGGGSNFAGYTFPFLRDKIAGKKIRVIASEPAACPTLTRGKFAYDFGDTVGLTPLVPMHTLGHDFVPSAIHAGGLRYHGAAPLVSQLLEDKLIEAVAYRQRECFESAVLFARTEGIVPAPESSHAVHAAIREALKCKEAGEAKTIGFHLSGHGHFDMSSYQAFLSGQLQDFEMSDAELKENLTHLPDVPMPV
ncbi:MAG: TrpB-like pyridoxal phosphate-dependent enzyme [Spirochaetia bacterium]|nr:TrpB-like pyridoxal phosphate-dependent enzyme [Spirochaetia bacterium]